MKWHFHDLQNTFVSSPFHLSCRLLVSYIFELGSKILTSKSTIWYFVQNHLALIFNLFKFRRGGSIRTMWHTRIIKFSITLHKWLCLNETKPPYLQDKLCWRSYFTLQLHIWPPITYLYHSTWLIFLYWCYISWIALNVVLSKIQ